MPFERRQELGWEPGKASGSYNRIVSQLHRSLYMANVGADFVFPTASAAELSQYKLLIVPTLYVADDALLKKISDYVQNGGHVLMTFKSGFTNENSAVRWERAPGPLRQAAGFNYQEFSNLEHPLALKDDPFHAGEENKVSTWAEFLQLETAKPLAFYEHPFFGRWAAITSNQFGSGVLTYEGTAVSDKLQQTIVLDELRAVGLVGPDQQVPANIRVKHGIGNDGRRMHYYLNYSSVESNLKYSYGAGKDLLTGSAIANGEQLTVKAWDVAIVEETAAN
jgi:beta-galactosidase